MRKLFGFLTPLVFVIAAGCESREFYNVSPTGFVDTVITIHTTDTVYISCYKHNHNHNHKHKQHGHSHHCDSL